MITKAFAIYDTKGHMYGTPFFMPQAGMAIRAFMDLVNDRQSSVNKHPSDYILYEIGTFDDNTAEFGSKIPPTQLGNAADFVDVRGASDVGDFAKIMSPEKDVALGELDRVENSKEK